VLGQEQAIRTIGGRMKSHVLAVRDVDRPLALLLPGPTGVGKKDRKGGGHCLGAAVFPAG
jgi:ATP-dependent Clp protease ATP-binding subunit ClpA